MAARAPSEISTATNDATQSEGLLLYRIRNTIFGKVDA